MFEIKGINGESIVVEGAWVEKLRGGTSIARKPASSYRDLTVDEFSRRKFVVFGEREQLLQIVIAMDTFFGLTVPAEQHAEVERLRSELEAARDRAAAES